MPNKLTNDQNRQPRDLKSAERHPAPRVPGVMPGAAGPGQAGRQQGKPAERPQAAAAKPGADAAAQKNHRGHTVAIVVACLLVVVAVIVGIVMSLGNDFFDSSAQSGQAPYKSQEEIQEELNRKVEEGMLNISIASVIEFEDGTSEGTAYIENVPSNHYVMQVDITLDDTGETIYQSGGLKPDTYIEKIPLSRDLDAGTYAATAMFHALDPTTFNEVGQAAAKVTINVLN